jgi:GWxTD domain-containing protein
MKRIVLRALAFTIAVAAFANGASAQWHSHDSRMYYDYGDPVMTSVIQSPDGRTVDVRLTTSSAMFSFLRAKNSTRGEYFAIREVTFEVDQQGNAQPVLSRNIHDTIYAKTFDESVSKTCWHAMSERFTLPPLDTSNKYALHIEVRDNVDRLVMRPQIIDLRLIKSAHPRYLTGGEARIAIGDIGLADSVKNSIEYTSARGNTYMFSRNIIGVAAFRLPDTTEALPNVDINVRQVSNLINPEDTGQRYHGQLDLSDLHQKSSLQFIAADSILRYELLPDSDGQLWTAIFNVPGESFQQGKYEFTFHIKSGNAEQTQKNDFMLVWQNMPLTLQDPEDAIPPLETIMKPEDFAALNSGSDKEKMRKLYAYWNTQYPAKGSAYNDHMATFYQRVDYAAFNFTTTRMLNGATTDRGKVYILYGPPTKIERSFIPGESPTETWSYTNNVGKIFHFVENGSPGEYKLSNIQEIASKGNN